MTAPDEDRRAALVRSLAAVRRRIADACARTGRDPRTVTLVAVTKTYPASDIVSLAGLGVSDIGENRDQEAAAKVAAVDELLRAPGASELPRPTWHFVGQLQTNKARRVVRYADVVHSVDRPELVTALADAVARAERASLDVFVQVSLDGDPDRGGVPISQVPALADQVAARAELRLRGVMAVAPLGADPDAAFAEMARVALLVRAGHPEAIAISAGMSADLEPAVAHGATHVRVGSALLGRRTDHVR